MPRGFFIVYFVLLLSGPFNIFSQRVYKDTDNYFDLGYSGFIHKKYLSSINNFELFISNELSTGEPRPDKIRLVYSYIANCYKKIGNYQKAIGSYLNSLEYIGLYDAESKLALTFNRLGELYSITGEYDKALEYYSKALRYFNESEWDRYIITCHLKIGDIYLIKKDYKVIPALSCGVACIFLLFFPEGHFWRIVTFNNLFIAFGAACFIVYFIEGLSAYIKKNKIKNMFVIILTLIIIVSIIPNVIMPKYYFIEGTSKANNENYFSYQFVYEIDAAFWLYSNTPKIWARETLWTGWMQEEDENTMIIHPPHLRNKSLKIKVSTTSDTLLISDPYTMFMMEGLTGRDQAVDWRVWIDEISEMAWRGGCAFAHPGFLREARTLRPAHTPD